jgi:hypothetical protein
MIITQTSSAYERALTAENEINVQYSDLIDIVLKPQLNVSKKESKYLIPFSHLFTDNTGTKVSYSDSQHAEFYQIIMLDIDGKAKIQDVSNKFNSANLQFVLYTSFSHTPHDHRFRVMIPLDFPMPMNKFNNPVRRETIKRIFPYTDSKSIKYMGFYAPIKTPDYLIAYNCNSNAQPFSFSLPGVQNIEKEEYNKYVKKQQKLKSLKPKIAKRSVLNNSTIQNYLGTPYLQKNGNGTSNQELFKSILISLTAGDNTTLNKIISKAKNEGWTGNQLQRKISDAQKIIGKT